MRFAPFKQSITHSASVMQAAYACEMEVERPMRRIRRLRLEEMLREAGGPKALAERSGVTDTHLTACVKGRRGIGDEMAHSLEVGMGKTFGWMDTDPEGAWPFVEVGRELFDRLGERQKGMVEAAMRDAIERLDGSAGNHKAA